MNSCDLVLPKQTRKIRPTRRSVSGVYAFRGETPIAFESTLERDFLIKAEFALDVLDVIPQPVQIPFIHPNGQTFIYTPDFLVYFRLGTHKLGDYPKPVLVEVKPQNEWRKHWRQWLSKWKAARRYAQQQGWIFHIHDESRIQGQALSNIRFLDVYKRMQFPIEESRWVIENLQSMGIASIDYLLSRHFMGIYRDRGMAHIWHLVATRQLECDINRPLNQFTELWVPNHV